MLFLQDKILVVLFSQILFLAVSIFFSSTFKLIFLFFYRTLSEQPVVHWSDERIVLTKLCALMKIPVPIFVSFLCYLTNRFHVAVCLFSNRSQMTSKCGKNKKVAHGAQPSVSLMFLPHFDVLCDLLLNRRTLFCIITN